jgi:1-acyl-sn-glycerol-3-phosphate acyltransferase
MRFLPAHHRLLLVGLHLLFGALQVALLFPLGGEPLRQRLKQTWSHQLVRLLGIRIEAPGDNLAGLEYGLLVGNHISFIDIFVINALLPSAFVAKSEVAQWPLIGWLARRSGTVFIERGSRKAAHLTHLHMLQALAAGRRLAIFPEGTTTAGDGVLPFHGALFQSAIDAGVPVHAIAISYHGSDGTRSRAPAYIDDIGLLECLTSVLKAGGLVARVTHATSFSPPLPDRRHLAHRAHQAIATALTKAIDAAPTPSAQVANRSNREGNPFSPPSQSLRNQAAIRR